LVHFHRNMVQLEILKKENLILKNELLEYKEMQLENSRLKSLLDFKVSLPYKSVAARVIGRWQDNWTASVVIDKGAKQGIRGGCVVVNHIGLVGRVIDVQPLTSVVMLLNDPRMGVSAVVQRSRQEGLVSGTLAELLVLRYLPLDADVQVGDTVVTSGLSDGFPKGVLVGSVVEVGNELSGLGRFASIKPAVRPSNLEEVLVIIRKE